LCRNQQQEGKEKIMTYRKLVKEIQRRAPRLRGRGAGLVEACEFADMVRFDGVTEEEMFAELTIQMDDPTPTARGN
jgi:hypothetical protein|tara:strand:- start:99 stop:326 length:228 start_codon:yes stop_codon:yes gene_type:complete